MIKVKDLKPGDTVEGWTVVEVWFVDNAARIKSDGTLDGWNVETIVLLTLESTFYLEGYDVNGEPVWWLLSPAARNEPPTKPPYPHKEHQLKNRTRRTWYRADEEVEP